ncbi:MAG: F-type H+-transporting ATPase subunit b [Candidatus Doudnabacteria bacterium Gr01-1014_77]|uniref:ATP synthase subunit b n=1 Tax=Candidatus Doudnabacteria bacterium Gr01-1014_77 TaxID=2017133 RepID=A0A554JAE5_9BACT|nr:MAG: F-type H+-transporting ATPase subunit b [Candidatus Doudnabacteria bacterium Gr01-1014_77]
MMNEILQILIPVAHAAEAQAAEAANSSVTALFGLDWKLFIAQLFNFAIVLIVLWRWVFKPLGAKLEQRTAKIEKSIKEAQEIQDQLKQVEQYRKAEMEKIRGEATEIVAKAQKTAEMNKDQIIAEAKKSAEKVLEQSKKELASEKEKLLIEVREEAATLVVAATEKILREKLDSKRDVELIKESLKGLR